MEGIFVFHSQIHDRRNRSCRCFSIPRAKLILMAALLCLFFLSWLIFNSVGLEIKDGRITGIQRNEMRNLMDLNSDFSILDRSPPPPPPPPSEENNGTAAEPVTEEEDEIQANFVSLVSADHHNFTEKMLQMKSLNQTQPSHVSLASKSPPSPYFSTTGTSEINRNKHGKNQQINNVINALKGAENFVKWAGILSSANKSSLPLSATLLIPGNDAISHLPTASTNAAGLMIFDPLLIPYHIVPQCLPFSQLQQLKFHTRLPTLLPSKFLLITNNSLNNFTIDDALITHPDIFLTPTFAVHGINKILEYSTYGDPGMPSTPLETTPKIPNNTLDNPQQNLLPPLLPAGEGAKSNTSGSACLSTEFPIALSVLLFSISGFVGSLLCIDGIGNLA